MKRSKILLLVAFLSLGIALMPLNAVAKYTPHQSDYFSYSDVIDLGSSTGNYQGYSEHQTYTGTETMNTVYGNGTVATHYSFTHTFSNSSGSSWSENWARNFTWSSSTFRYVTGSDNQTGYSKPYVWFFMDNTTASGGTFYLLNTQMTVQSTRTSFNLPSQNRYVYALFAQGTGSYQRNDVYGQFTATYTYKAYFDPLTGYIVGYNYVEQDTSPTQGFTWTENLAVTSTSYSLSTAPTPIDYAQILLYLAAVVAAIILIGIIAIAVRRSRRRLPQHPQHYIQEPAVAPPQIDLTPRQQPPVQQIIVKEVVKVKCKYCGALIDSTVQACPFCGAPRT